jgi:di- and tripeptidase
VLERSFSLGTTDNKGCTLAVACAAARLKRQDKLEVDLVMLIEGEEERGSHGFRDAVVNNLKEIGKIDV